MSAPPPPYEAKGAYPPPAQGQYPQYPPPQGQYPPPQGQYPPPQGQYPPQQGQYPPPQGQYPPAGAYAPPVTTSHVTVAAASPAVTVVQTGGCPNCRMGNFTDHYGCCAIFLAIFFFPIGILCCLAMRERQCTNCGYTSG